MSTKKNQRSIPVFIALGIIFTILGTLLYFGKTSEFISFFTVKVTSQDAESSLLTANYHSNLDFQKTPYATFRVKFPQAYMATSGEMITSFRSQGGIAPPVILLTKGYQPLSETEGGYLQSYREILNKGSDCIIIWETTGFNSSSDWTGLLFGEDITILSESKKSSGNNEFILREVKDKQFTNPRLDAFIQLPGDVSYYFTTCNTKNNQDLETVLKTFEIRGVL